MSRPLRAAFACWVLAASVASFAGPVNGDIVAYLAQARAGDWFDRVTHVGFVVPLWLLAPLPFAVLGLGTVGCAGGAARLNDRDGVRRLLSALVLTPIAGFAEVDPCWLLALMGAASLRSGALAAWAVAISPTALLALPALARDRRVWVGAATAVLLLSIGSAGEWWWGERGVWRAPAWAPGRVVGAWALAWPWALLPLVTWDRSLGRDLLAAAPLLVSPADVPGWAVPALRLVRNVEVRGRWGWVVLQAALTCALLVSEARRVSSENAAITATAAALRPGDGVEAPFSWGARLSYAVTGDPYGWRWHPPGGFLRDQRRAWCDAPPERVWVLPPRRDGGVDVRTDAAAVCR